MTDRKDTNPKDQCASNRIDLSLFPPSARAYGALGMTEGDLKYGGYNYRVAGVKASVYYAAAGRHLDRWFNGEEVDPKTKVPHLASALACIAILVDGVEQGNLNDDRPPAQPSDLYERLEGAVAHLRKTFPRASERYTNHATELHAPTCGTHGSVSQGGAGARLREPAEAACSVGLHADGIPLAQFWLDEIQCGGGP